MKKIWNFSVKVVGTVTILGTLSLFVLYFIDRITREKFDNEPEYVDDYEED